MAATDQHSTDDHSSALAAREDSAQEDRAQEPSAEWGWHGTFPRATNIAGWITAAALFLMLIGNHENYVEDVWLIGLGSLLVIMLIGGAVSRRRSRRR
ncbi:MAG: DUF2631 domain-containing protein [Pseudonocardiaceae bacterium]